MKYWKNITIDLPEIDLEVASDKILDLNILSVTIIDRRDPRESDWFHKSTEPISFNSKTHQISILIDEKHDSEELINSITKILELDENPKYKEEKIIDKDWVEHTHQQFNEILVTNSLRIVPPWSIGSDFDGHTVIIEPGSGFGVGTHPTTQLCMQWLESNAAMPHDVHPNLGSVVHNKLEARFPPCDTARNPSGHQQHLLVP